MSLVKIKQKKVVIKPSSGFNTKYELRFISKDAVDEFVKGFVGKDGKPVARFERHNCVIRRTDDSIIIIYKQINAKDKDVSCVINFSAEEVANGFNLEISNYVKRTVDPHPVIKHRRSFRSILRSTANLPSIIYAGWRNALPYNDHAFNPYVETPNDVANSARDDLRANGSNMEKNPKAVVKALVREGKEIIGDFKNDLNNGL